MTNAKIRIKDFYLPIIHENEEHLVKYYHRSDVDEYVKLFQAQKQIDSHIGEAKDIYVEIKNALKSCGKFDDASKAYYREREMEKKTFSIRRGNALFYYGNRSYKFTRRARKSMFKEKENPRFIYLSNLEKNKHKHQDEYKEILEMVLSISSEQLSKSKQSKTINTRGIPGMIFPICLKLNLIKRQKLTKEGENSYTNCLIGISMLY